MAFIPIEEIKQKLLKNGKYWISFTGDSITSCEWVHPNWRDIIIYVLNSEFTKHLDGDWRLSEWGIRGFNFAYDGATTKDIVEKLDDVLLVKPDLVIGLMGGNDDLFGVTVEESVANIGKIVEKTIDSGAQIIWSNSTPAGAGDKKNDQYQPYADAFMEMPDIQGLDKIDMFNIYQQFPSQKIFTFISEGNPDEGVEPGEIDQQHPNQLGNAYIAKVMLDKIFGIEFNPEKYIQDTLNGEKLPGY